MPIFQYTGLSETGGEVKGLIDAESAREARERLRGEQRIHVVTMREAGVMDGNGGGGAAKGGAVSVGGSRRQALNELVIVTRQLAVLIGAGIPLADAIGALIQQVESKRMEATLRNIRESIVQGSNFADALARHPALFNDLYVNMVKAGEAAGCLDEILVRLADYQQKQAKLRGKVRAALTYPVFMVIIAVGVVSILMTFVVPRIIQVLNAQGSKGTMPLPTKILISVSYVFEHYWWMMAIAVGVMWVMFRAWVKSEPGERSWDTFKLKVPVIGVLNRKAAISRFAVTLATLLKSGLPATQALKVVRNVVGNVVLSDAIQHIHDRIVSGADIASGIRETKLFPPMVSYMVATGEQSGQLDQLLERLAESYDDELEETSAKVTAILEPIMIVVLALVVGGIVFAIVLPMLEIANVK